MSIGSKIAAVLLLCASGALAHAPNGISGTNLDGISIARKPQFSHTPIGYQGPGDLVTSGGVAWYGLRAYTAAIAAAGNKIIRIHRINDDQQCDLRADSAGGLGRTVNCEQNISNQQAPETFCNATTCVVVALYDQIGSNDLKQSITSSQPTLTFNCLGSAACITLVGVQQFISLNSVTLAQPLSVVVAALYNGTDSNTDLTLSENGDAVQVGFNAFTADVIYGYAGTILSSTGNTPIFHVIQFIANDPTSRLTINGTNTSGSAGTNAFSTQLTLGAMNGQFVEGGIWKQALTPGQQSSITNNTRTYWGF